MDVVAVWKGKARRATVKNKWKDKDQEAAADPDADVICYHRHRKGTGSETVGPWRRRIPRMDNP